MEQSALLPRQRTFSLDCNAFKHFYSALGPHGQACTSPASSRCPLSWAAEQHRPQTTTKATNQRRNQPNQTNTTTSHNYNNHGYEYIGGGMHEPSLASPSSHRQSCTAPAPSPCPPPGQPNKQQPTTRTTQPPLLNHDNHPASKNYTTTTATTMVYTSI